MTNVFVGSDNGPEAQDNPRLCLRARSDGYAATCGQTDHCPACQWCADVHPDDCDPINARLRQRLTERQRARASEAIRAANNTWKAANHG